MLIFYHYFKSRPQVLLHILPLSLNLGFIVCSFDDLLKVRWAQPLKWGSQACRNEETEHWRLWKRDGKAGSEWVLGVRRFRWIIPLLQPLNTKLLLDSYYPLVSSVLKLHQSLTLTSCLFKETCQPASVCGWMMETATSGSAQPHSRCFGII